MASYCVKNYDGYVEVILEGDITWSNPLISRRISKSGFRNYTFTM